MHRLSKLNNGLNLITVPVPGTKAATVMVMFPVGSRFETKEISGASHFVEHMIFKGTEKRPSYLDISRALDSVGAEYNAFTSKDSTAYYIKIDGEKLDTALEILADIVFHSVLQKEEVEKEKGVILEELKMYEDNPSMAVDLLSDRITFGDHPLGWDIGGNAATVAGIGREELHRYYRKYYEPNNAVLAVAGNIEKMKFKKGLEHFKMPAGKSVPQNFPKFNWPQGLSLEKRVAVSERKVDQAQVIINFPGLSHDHPEKYAAAILLSILGGGMSSRLFVEVREKRGLAYVVHTGSASYKETGVAGVQAGLDPKRLKEAFKVIKDELIKIKESNVSAKELADAKNYIAGHMALSMEDSSSQAQWFARQFLFGKEMETSDVFLKRLKKISAGEVKKLAEKFFDFEKMTVSVIGPMGKDEVMDKLK